MTKSNLPAPHALAVLGTLIIGGILAAVAATQSPSVGLSLFFQNGAMSPLTFSGNPARYLQEIDIVSTSVAGTTDDGIQPLQNSGDFAGLDWTGVHQVEEEWKTATNGTFTRVRYYRGANWMTRHSTFTLNAVDSNGNRLGASLTADAGLDSRLSESLDDGWVRRFLARQTASGCPAVNNCTGAKFVAQGLVQFRDALNPSRRAATLASGAAGLELQWSESKQVYKVALNHVPSTAFSFGYGFKPVLQAVNPPANGLYYLPGDQIQLRITLLDGAGHRLHPSGSLPTYRQVRNGTDQSGIRYYNPNLNPQLYYALKHREANSLVTLAGPTNALTTAKELGAIDIFTPQVVTASAAVDGFSALLAGFPPLAVTRGTASWDTPVSDIITFTLPLDAKPGTYVAALKARREFSGEALNRGAVLDLQVGTASTTPAASRIGGCEDCHEGRAAFTQILHGLPDRRPCAGCHNGSTFIGAYDQRVHTIHDRSNRFDENVRECAVCHLDSPTGPARGIVIHAGPALSGDGN